MEIAKKIEIKKRKPKLNRNSKSNSKKILSFSNSPRSNSVNTSFSSKSNNNYYNNHKKSSNTSNFIRDKIDLSGILKSPTN